MTISNRKHPVQLTQAFLCETLDYDPDTGLFRWRMRSDVPKEWNTRWAGKIITYTNGGYVIVTINYEDYRAARLAWLYVTGEWPPDDIDHINRDRADDRFCNLRLATRSENLCNIGLKSNNTSGFKGVSFVKKLGRWRAAITLNGQEKYLGSYKTKEEAAEAYRKAAIATHGEFVRIE